MADLKASDSRGGDDLQPQRSGRSRLRRARGYWARGYRALRVRGYRALRVRGYRALRVRGYRALRVRGPAVAAAIRPAALWRNHRLFGLLVVLAIGVRVLATLAFRPALFIPDSFDYLHDGAHLVMEQLRPAGYPILLRAAQPFHSLLLVTTLQHLMGIGEAIIVYGLLRHWGLPAWGAALATVPTLFDARQVALESYILPDALFGFVILVAVALLLTKRTPAIWPCVGAGLLLAWASVLRGNGAPIMVALLAFMLIRRAGWRACGPAWRRSPSRSPRTWPSSTRSTARSTSPAAPASSCGHGPCRSPTARSSSHRRTCGRSARIGRPCLPRA